MTINIRRYQSEDLIEIIDLFKKTVRAINSDDYSSAQIAAWASAEQDLSDWKKSLDAHITYVAIQKEKVVGFADMTEAGYLDRLYVHPDFKGKWIAKKLFLALCKEAKNRSLEKITTHASITAMPYAKHLGFQVTKVQEVECRGQKFKNFYMELLLRKQDS